LTFRRELRNHLTPAEAKLWTYLQKSQLEGRKFRRQHSVGCYILDFYCPAERLAIELDGEVHAHADAQRYDEERDLFLNHFGIYVVRFENKLVFQQTEAVLMQIKSYFHSSNQLPNHPPPAAYPSLERRGVRAVASSTLPLPRGSTPKGGGG
jgi:very-short-patch-repair endonuclease